LADLLAPADLVDGRSPAIPEPMPSRDVLAYDTCVARHPQEQVLCEGPQQAPPIGATTSTLPSGAVSQTVNGVTYYSFGGAYYRPYYSGSSVFYEVVANPA
jgi:hypothetical protein